MPNPPHDSRLALPFRHYIKIRNLGDSINADILEEVSGCVPVFSPSSKPHVLGIGSIFSSANRFSFVWGSGVHHPEAELPTFRPHQVHALRGKLSAQVLRAKGHAIGDVPLGDPGTLIGRLLAHEPPVSRRFRACIVPHHNSFHHPAFKPLQTSAEVAIVDMMDQSLRPLIEIAASDVVISQSLHGLIFAQALGKPFLWITRRLDTNWQFKFLDWSSTLAGAPIAPVMLGLSIDEMIARAEPRASLIDEAALIAALPVKECAYELDTPVVDYRTCRRASPAFVDVPRADLEALSTAYRDGQGERALHALVAASQPNWAIRVYTAFSAGMRIDHRDMTEMTRYMDENPAVAFATIETVREKASWAASKRTPGGVCVKSGAIDHIGAILVRPTLAMRPNLRYVTFGVPPR